MASSNLFSCAVAILDKDMKIIWANKIVVGWFRPLSAIRGTYCYNTFEKRNKICPGCPSIKVFKYGLSKCVSLRRNISIAGGQKRHLRLTATPVRDNEGRIIQVLELVEDVTGKVNIEKEVKKKKK